MNTSQTTCDHCGADLSDGKSQPHQLTLSGIRSGPFQWNPDHPIGTCEECGMEVTYNVPRLRSDGGFIHKDTGRLHCATIHHFCGIPCLEQWLGTRKPRAVATAQSGTVSSVTFGSGPGYRCPPIGSSVQPPLIADDDPNFPKLPAQEQAREGP